MKSAQPHSLHQRLTVPFDFPVHFARDTFAPTNSLLADTINRLRENRRHRVMVCLDKGAAKAWPRAETVIRSYFKAHSQTLELAGPVETIPGGERAKQALTAVTRLIERMAALNLDFLDRLPDRDWIAGIAEAFKVAMIKDRRFFQFLCAHATRLRARDRSAMERLIRDCARLHLDHIRTSGDPFETGSARPLDFGHWSAHQLEVMSRYRIRHGEAVSIGIALDSYVAMRLGLISQSELNTLLKGLKEAGLPLWHRLLPSRNRAGKLALLVGLARFQEHLGGPLTITLPAPIGRRTEIHEMQEKLIQDGIKFLASPLRVESIAFLS